MKSIVLALFLAVLIFSAHGAQATVVVVKPVEELAVGEPVVVNGVLRSKSDILLPAGIDGELIQVLEEGTHVTRDQVLAKVDDAQLKLQREEQSILAERAEINIRYLQDEVDRLTRLEKSNLASRTQLAEMTSRRDLAANDLRVARSRIAQLDETLSRTEIVSPVDGVISERLRQGGEFARRGEGVVRVVDPEELEVVVTIPAAYISRIGRGQGVRVTVNDVVFEAPLRSLIRASNPTSQTVDALVDVPAGVAVMVVSGQFAEVSVPLSKERTSLFVPRDAVVLRSEGSFVYRIDENNVAQRIDVILGTGQGELVSVTGKLNPGDNVAVRGVERLSDGQTVSLTNT
jgi:RND family efflux transporter MFP subunit